MNKSLPITWGLLCTHETGLTPECEICHQQWKWAWKQEDGIATQSFMRNEAKGLWTCSCPKHSRKMIFQSDIMEVPGEIHFSFRHDWDNKSKVKICNVRPNTKKTISVSEMPEYTLLCVGLSGRFFPYRGSQWLLLWRIIFKSRTHWKRQEKSARWNVILYGYSKIAPPFEKWFLMKKKSPLNKWTKLNEQTKFSVVRLEGP